MRYINRRILYFTLLLDETSLSILTVSVGDCERCLRHHRLAQSAVDSDRPDTEHVLAAGRQSRNLVRLHLGRQLLDRQPRVLVDVSALDEVAGDAGHVLSGGRRRRLPLEGDRAAANSPVCQLGRCRRRLCTSSSQIISRATLNKFSIVENNNLLLFSVVSREFYDAVPLC